VTVGHRGIVRTAVVAGLAVFAAACSSGSAKPLGVGTTSPTSGAPTSTSTTAPGPSTTTVESTKAAVLASYRGLWQDIATVEGHYPVNPLDPVLTRHAAGNERAQVGNFATTLKFQNQYLAGPAVDTSRAIVKQLVGTVAVVADCEYDGSILMNGRTNQVVNPAGSQRRLVNAKVEWTEGVWKVTQLNNVSDGCTVAL
jgi:hypothetical protein